MGSKSVPPTVVETPPSEVESRIDRLTPEAARSGAFRAAVEDLFATHFPRVFRIVNRLSGEPDLAADVAQEAFVSLYERGSLPDTPVAWVITVALNRFRNRAAKRSRRLRLLTAERAAQVLSDPAPSPAQAIAGDEARDRVRAALALLPERDCRMLLLCAEGYRYRDIAAALNLNEASVGTLLARAKRAFRDAYGAYGDDADAS
jgi:RNA polymerase sigma-70 factor (ECF subfamily)